MMAPFENRQMVAAHMAADPYRVVTVIETHADAITIQNIECDLKTVLSGEQLRAGYEEIERIAMLVGDVPIGEIAREELGLLAEEQLPVVSSQLSEGETVDGVIYMPEPER